MSQSANDENKGTEEALVLDFNEPLPVRLDDPDRFSDRLATVVGYLAEHLEVEAESLDYMYLCDGLPEEKRRPIVDAVNQLCITLRLVQGQIGAVFQPADSTEFQRCKAMVRASPGLAALSSGLAALEQHVNQIPKSDWLKGNAFLGPREITVDNAYKIAGHPHIARRPGDFTGSSFRSAVRRETRAARRALDRIRVIFGEFDDWARNPDKSAIRAWTTAWRNGEIDADRFFSWIRETRVGLGPKDAGHLASAILGQRTDKQGEQTLPGDSQVVRKNRLVSLIEGDDDEVRKSLTKAARSKIRSDNSIKQNTLTRASNAVNDPLQRIEVSAQARQGIAHYAKRLEAGLETTYGPKWNRSFKENIFPIPLAVDPVESRLVIRPRTRMAGWNTEEHAQHWLFRLYPDGSTGKKRSHKKKKDHTRSVTVPIEHKKLDNPETIGLPVYSGCGAMFNLDPSGAWKFTFGWQPAAGARDSTARDAVPGDLTEEHQLADYAGKIARQLGFSEDQAQVFIGRVEGTARKRDNESIWKFIDRHVPEIKAAILADENSILSLEKKIYLSMNQQVTEKND